jgi:Adenylate and Guanylate cyclase catalytic domain/AAA ATPase domain
MADAMACNGQWIRTRTSSTCWCRVVATRARPSHSSKSCSKACHTCAGCSARFCPSTTPPEAAAEVIQPYAGHIAQYLGDGLLVYFGYPQVHEDDAQRAVHAGLEMVEGISTLNARLTPTRGFRIDIRVGIHTGPVMVGEMSGGSRHELLALGDTPNIAARLWGFAAPNTVVISAATQHLVQGYFTMAALGPQVLKGVASPVPLYCILGVNAAQSRLEVASSLGLTPLAGREAEVALLLERWAQSHARQGQVMLLSGEAGIGKSRLVEVLREQVAREGHAPITFRCSPYHTIVPSTR